jgi:endonuclease-3
MVEKDRVREILKRLRKAYPETGPFVEWSTPLELVVGTVLSAQCTDERVNMVTKVLFAKYKTAEDYAKASLPTLEREIFSTGFYRNKAKHLKSLGKILVEKFGGNVPNMLEGLLSLPGVSNKTAYIVLSKAFGKHVGLAVDTHVSRVAPRLGLTTASAADKMSQELGTIFMPRDYLAVNELFIMHGRAVCAPRKPLCGECVLAEICPSAGAFLR